MFEKTTRNHPTQILEQIYYYLFAVIFFVYEIASQNTPIYRLSYWKGIFRQLAQGNFKALLSGAGLALLFVFLLAVTVLRWSRTGFRIENGMLISERKTLLRKISRLPLENIATVNLERNVFEKTVGTAKVKIDINSAVTADATDYTFVLRLDKAEALKRVLTAERTEQAEDETPVRRPVVSFSDRDAIRHTLLQMPMFEIITIGMVAWPFLTGRDRSGDVVGLLIIPVVLFLLSSVISLLNNCAFRLEDDDTHIYITHGKLNLHCYSFEKNRVKGVFIRQSVLARLFGRYSIELAVVGLGNEKNESPRLCLLVKKEEVERILERTFPQYCENVQPVGQDALSILPGLVKTALVCLLCVPVLLFDRAVGLPLLLCAAAVGTLGSVLVRFTRRAAAGEEIFCSTTGILYRKTCLLRYEDIQTVCFSTVPGMKRKGLGRITYSIMASRKVSVQKTGWFSRELFEKVGEKINGDEKE